MIVSMVELLPGTNWGRANGHPTPQARNRLRRKELIRPEEPWNWAAVTTAGLACAEVDNIWMRRVALPTVAEPAVTLFWLETSSTSRAQNTKRNANCMKRGVVSVDRYLPNSLLSYESEGCAPRTS